MRRLLLLALVSALIAAFTSAAHTDDRAGGLARVKVSSAEDAAFVASNFDESHNRVPGYVEVVLWPGDAAELDALGYDYDIVIPDLAAHDAAVAARTTLKRVEMPGPDRSDYRRLGDYESEMEALAKDHPGLVKVFELPYETREGRVVKGIEIAHDVKAHDGRPTYYVDGLHHAREWPAGEYPMIFAHYLVEGFGEDDDITRLLKRLRVVIVPVVNPDGFDYSRESITGQNHTVDSALSLPLAVTGLESYWRKNRRSFTGFTVPELHKNPDAYGVDPNRNYSFHWGGDGSSAQQTSQTYRGDAPFSEPETQNVRDKILADNVTSIITNHTYSRLVLRAWGDTNEDAPDERYLRKLGQKMADAMGGYQNIKSIQLYVTTGTMSDWGYGVLGIPSYTFEHGRAFHPPYSGCESDCVGELWPGVMKAFMYAAEAALDERMHGIVTGRVVDSRGRPVTATLDIAKRFATPLAENNPLGEDAYKESIETTMRATGSFEWHLPASTRPHVVEKGGKESYMLTVKAKGFPAERFTFVLDQGERLDLGKIRL